MNYKDYGTVASSAIANIIMLSLRYFTSADIFTNIYTYTMFKEAFIFILDVTTFKRSFITTEGIVDMRSMSIYNRFKIMVTLHVLYKFLVSVCISFILIDTIYKAIIKFLENIKLKEFIASRFLYYDIVIRILIGGISSVLITSYMKNIWVYNEIPDPITNIIVIMWFGISLLIYTKQC